MFNLLLGAIAPVIGKIVDRLVPDKNLQVQVQTELLRMAAEGELKALEADIKLAIAQIEVNKEEAKSLNPFNAWRPGAGWVCVFGLGYNFIIQPLLSWVCAIYGVVVPPMLDNGDLMTILMGMLGLGGYRTYEKLKGVDK